MVGLGCRHACFGSAEASLPALLPFIACLPRSLLGPTPAVLAQVSSQRPLMCLPRTLLTRVSGVCGQS